MRAKPAPHLQYTSRYRPHQAAPVLIVQALQPQSDSGLKSQRRARLLFSIPTQPVKEFAGTFGILPGGAIKPVVVSAGLCGHPHLMQRSLQIDDDLGAVGKCQCHHAACALAVHIRVPRVVDAIATTFNGEQQFFCLVQEFKVGHYNLRMLIAFQTPVRPIALAASAAVLWGCGQRGPLYLPGTPEASQRATLPETLSPVKTAPTATAPASVPR